MEKNGEKEKNGAPSGVSSIFFIISSFTIIISELLILLTIQLLLVLVVNFHDA